MISISRDCFSVTFKNTFSVSIYDAYDPDVDDKFSINQIYIRVCFDSTRKYIKFSNNEEKYLIQDSLVIPKIMTIASEAIDFDDCQEKINLFTKVV